jgi:hypothetical protein
VIKTEAVGWSNKIFSNPCPKCKKNKTQQYVEIQKRLKLGPRKLINFGFRDTAMECSNCSNISILTKTQEREAKRMKYYFKRPTQANIGDKNELTRNVKYPILDLETRKRIRSKNKQEGFTSAVLGLVIGLILNIWFSWGIWIGIIFVLFGLYGAIEDPVLKFQHDLEKSRQKKLPLKKLSSNKSSSKKPKRSLK